MGYLEIAKDMVYPMLMKRRKVYGVVFKSKYFNEKLYELLSWCIDDLNQLLGERVKYFIEESK